MSSHIVFRRIQVRSFRILSSVDFEPAARLNVISGDNGQGKTSVIEAVYLVATSRSFRTEHVAETLSTGASQAVIAARIEEAGVVREQRVALGARARSYRVDGKRPASLASYATQTPVVVFHPGDLTLVSGPAAGRRRLLDRVALFYEPVSADHRARYQRALRARQATLEERGPRSPELDAYEALIAEHGVAFAGYRRRTAERLIELLSETFGRVAAPGLRLEAVYQAGGSEDREHFRAALAGRRLEDRRRGRPSFGPQRDELELALGSMKARAHASQGQQRVLALALKLAELSCLESARGADPVLLLDDVSSELDPARTGAVYRFLEAARSQVFVTTTRPELLATPELVGAERADFAVVSGRVSRV